MTSRSALQRARLHRAGDGPGAGLLCCLLLPVLLATGCAQTAGTMEVRPVLEVRHGMRTADALVQLARYHRGTGDMARTEQAYRRALEADPDHPAALGGLGGVLAERGELGEAEALFARAAAAQADAAYLYNNLGYVQMQQGDFPAARASLLKALTLRPDYAQARANLKLLGQRTGDRSLVAQAEARPASSPDSAQAVNAPPVLALAMDHAITLPRTKRPEEESGIAVAGAPKGVHLRNIRQIDIMPSSGDQPVVIGALRMAPRIELANGNGVRRFASRIGTSAREQGHRIARIRNGSSYAVKRTVIEYRRGYEAEARAFAAMLKVDAVLREQTDAIRWAEMRVILGHDLLRSASSRT